jgi:hypothetical protein
MSFAIFTLLDNTLKSITGSMAIVAICILAFFIIAFMFLGLDFKWALMLSSPALMGMAAQGWFGINGNWIVPFLWILIVGIGIYMLWTWLSDR